MTDNKLRATLDKLKDAIYQREMDRAVGRTAAVVVAVGNPPHIVRVSETAAALFGYDQAELIDQPLNILIPARYHGAHDGHFASYDADPTRREMGGKDGLFGLRKNGEEFRVIVGLDHAEILDEACSIATIREQKV